MSVFLIKTYDFSGSVWDLCALFRGEPHLFCLDSNRHGPENGRYSFVGFDPFEIFQAKGAATLGLLKERYSAYRGEPGTKATPFRSGIVGYLGYDCGLYQEKILLRSEDDLKLPDAVFGFYDCVLTIDHLQKKLYVTSSGLPEKNKALREKRAASRLEHVERALARPFSPSVSKHFPCDFSKGLGDFSSNFTKDEYLVTVRKVLEYIAAGDIYQLNLSQRFTYDTAGENVDPLEIYRALRQLSPVSFGGYFNAGAFKLISNSPEMFLRLRDGVVQTRPMKGTRPRGSDQREDVRLR